jgi:hypothetical protein
MARRKKEPPLLADQGEFAKRMRRWVWFYLAAAVILAVSFGVHYGLPVYRQQQVLDEVARLQGWAGAREGGPKWLREKLGNERMKGFDEIRAVNLDGKEVTDSTLSRLAEIRSLRWLSVNRTQITDAGLAQLKSLTLLETLMLDETHVTDAGLEHLNALSNLHELHLAGTDVTEAGIVSLKKERPQLELHW